ncbi:MAG: hypothetical protein SFY67_06570 [Candidatus Melainabacteria bacterium]|nr:hypothetical protein [Candidatus Melainabacteria bacterium]
MKKHAELLKLAGHSLKEAGKLQLTVFLLCFGLAACSNSSNDSIVKLESQGKTVLDVQKQDGGVRIDLNAPKRPDQN